MQPVYGMALFWAQGDWVTRLIALILFTMSIASWYVLLTRAWRWGKYQKHAQAANHFWHAKNFSEGLNGLIGSRSENPFLLLAEDCQAAVEHHQDNRAELHGQLALTDWVTSCLKGAIEEAHEHMNKRVAVLASIGSTAPFVGLFGTVWGIYHALMSISITSQVGIDKLAGPVGESLIMTAFGLGVAIPAVLGYNFLVRSHRAIYGKLNRFAHDLHAYFVTGSPVSKPEAFISSLPAAQIGAKREVI